MSMTSSLTRRAIELAKAGKRQDANRILAAVIHDDPDNQTAWNWYIETLEAPQERIQALEQYLAAYPDNWQALRALGMLKRQQAARETPAAAAARPPALPAYPPHTTPAAPLPPQPFEPIAVSRTKPSPHIPYGTLIALLSLVLVVLLLLYTYKLKGHYESLQSSYTNLQIALEVARQEKAQLTYQLDKLSLDYQALDTAHKALSKSYTDLESTYTSLTTDYANLNGQYDTLNQDYAALQGRFKELKAEYKTLTGEVETLKSDYTSLYGWYSWLQTNAITPPYIAIHDRQVTLGFYGPDGSVQTWTKDVAELEQAIIAGERNRASPSYLYLDVNGSQVTEENYAPYIDPAPFTDYIPYLYHASGSDYAFIQNVRRIISQLAVYNTENYEVPRHPLETFLMGGGDCEDLSILLASMLLAAPVDWEVRMVFMDYDHPQDAQTINHVIVYVDTGKEKFLLEPTNPETFWSFDTQGWTVDVSR